VILVIAMAGMLGAAGYLVHTRRPSIINAKAFPQLRFYPAWFRPKGFVYLFSGAQGWTAADEETARDLARRDHMVFGIDTPQFLRTQNSLPGCIFMPGVLEDYSRPWQRDNDIPAYLAPALLGSDIGATLVYEAQLSSPPTAFSAAVAIDPQTSIEMQRPFCEHAAAALDASGQTIKAERPGRNVPLKILSSAAATPAQRQFAASIPTLPPIAIPAGEPMHRSYIRALEAMEKEAQRSGVADLPLAEVPALRGGCAKGFAVLYSGDGGWRDLDRSLADVLASKGMNVVGVDVLRYYWKEKPPAQAAPDLVRILHHYAQAWQCSKAVLIGFSFGADVLPFLVNHLPAEARQQVVLMTLLSPERTTAFEVQVNGWLGGQPKAGEPVGPEVRKLQGMKIQCVYGQDEGAGSLCTDPAAGTLTVLVKSGGHHFDKNYGELADDILAALPP
jgi:type IV secretory pathway VirJ component